MCECVACVCASWGFIQSFQKQQRPRWHFCSYHQLLALIAERGWAEPADQHCLCRRFGNRCTVCVCVCVGPGLRGGQCSHQTVNNATTWVLNGSWKWCSLLRERFSSVCYGLYPSLLALSWDQVGFVMRSIIMLAFSKHPLGSLNCSLGLLFSQTGRGT